MPCTRMLLSPRRLRTQACMNTHGTIACLQGSACHEHSSTSSSRRPGCRSCSPTSPSEDGLRQLVRPGQDLHQHLWTPRPFHEGTLGWLHSIHPSRDQGTACSGAQPAASRRAESKRKQARVQGPGPSACLRMQPLPRADTCGLLEPPRLAFPKAAHTSSAAADTCVLHACGHAGR